MVGRGFRTNTRSGEACLCARECVRLGVGEGEERLRPATRVRAPLGTTATAWRVAMCEQCKARPVPAATASAQVVGAVPCPPQRAWHQRAEMRNRFRSVADADLRAAVLRCAVPGALRRMFAFFVARRRAGESTHLLLPPRVVQHVYKRFGVPATDARRGREGIG